MRVCVHDIIYKNYVHVCVFACVPVGVCAYDDMKSVRVCLKLTSSQTTACSIPSIPPSGESRLPEIIRSFTAAYQLKMYTCVHNTNFKFTDMHITKASFHKTAGH